MKDLLTDLSRSECGKRLLINLWEGLSKNHIVKDRAFDVLSGLSISTSWDVHKREIAKVIFNRPEDFQFCGPVANHSPAEWMTVKSMADMLYILRGDAASLSAHLQTRLGIIDSGGPHIGLKSEQYVRFAETLSDPDDPIRFLLAKNFNRRAAPSWYSRWCECPFRDFYEMPSTDASGRFRDWLGLTYGFQDPLFIIRARRPLPVDDMKAHRPTAWDGFDNPLYKHRTTPERDRERCGSSADVAKLRGSPSPTSDIEGGPEIVSRGVTFDPDRFVCEYMGAAPAIDYDLYDAPFHKMLLQTNLKIESIIERVLDFLMPSRPVTQ